MISPNGIRAIFFDLDGTLRHSRPSANQIFFDYAVKLGVAESQQGRRKALRWAHYYWANSRELQADRQTFADNDTLFWQNYAYFHLTAYGCQPELAKSLAQAMQQWMMDEYQPEDWIPPEVPKTLSALYTAGFLLGIVSNRREPIQDYLMQTGLGKYTTFSLTAGEVNAWKPDREIFQHALRQSATRPEETLFVGDNYYADILGSQAAGLRPVLVDPDALFPEANCPVIQAISDLPHILADT